MTVTTFSYLSSSSQACKSIVEVNRLIQDGEYTRAKQLMISVLGDPEAIDMRLFDPDLWRIMLERALKGMLNSNLLEFESCLWLKNFAQYMTQWYHEYKGAVSLKGFVESTMIFQLFLNKEVNCPWQVCTPKADLEFLGESDRLSISKQSIDEKETSFQNLELLASRLVSNGSAFGIAILFSFISEFWCREKRLLLNLKQRERQENSQLNRAWIYNIKSNVKKKSSPSLKIDYHYKQKAELEIAQYMSRLVQIGNNLQASFVDVAPSYQMISFAYLDYLISTDQTTVATKFKEDIIPKMENRGIGLLLNLKTCRYGSNKSNAFTPDRSHTRFDSIEDTYFQSYHLVRKELYQDAFELLWREKSFKHHNKLMLTVELPSSYSGQIIRKTVDFREAYTCLMYRTLETLLSSASVESSYGEMLINRALELGTRSTIVNRTVLQNTYRKMFGQGITKDDPIYLDYRIRYKRELYDYVLYTAAIRHPNRTLNYPLNLYNHKFYTFESNFSFGKYKSHSLRDLLTMDPEYIYWCAINLDHFILDPAVLLGRLNCYGKLFWSAYRHCEYKLLLVNEGRLIYNELVKEEGLFEAVKEIQESHMDIEARQKLVRESNQMFRDEFGDTFHEDML